MKTRTKGKRRPAILVRFYPQDMELLNSHCQRACTPRENFIRRSVLASIRAAAIGLPAMPVDPEQMTLAEAQHTVATGKAIQAMARRTPNPRRLTAAKKGGKKAAAKPGSPKS